MLRDNPGWTSTHPGKSWNTPGRLMLHKNLNYQPTFLLLLCFYNVWVGLVTSNYNGILQLWCDWPLSGGQIPKILRYYNNIYLRSQCNSLRQFLHTLRSQVKGPGNETPCRVPTLQPRSQVISSSHSIAPAGREDKRPWEQGCHSWSWPKGSRLNYRYIMGYRGS